MSGAVLAAGILFGVGERIGQWLLPAPYTQVVLCVPPSDLAEESCVLPGADELMPPNETGRVQYPEVRSI